MSKYSALTLLLDYYEEINRQSIFSERDAPLFLARVTTWRETGQTALLVCIWHGLGEHQP